MAKKSKNNAQAADIPTEEAVYIEVETTNGEIELPTQETPIIIMSLVPVVRDTNTRQDENNLFDDWKWIPIYEGDGITRKTDIKKVKLENGYFIVAEYTEKIETEDDSTTNETAVKRYYPVHKDFTAALDALRIHALIICELIRPEAYTDYESISLEPHEQLLFDKMQVTAVTWGGSGEHEGVTIIGQLKLHSKKVINLIAPFTKFEDENNGYKHERDLHKICVALAYETYAYLFENKHSERGKQLNLF